MGGRGRLVVLALCGVGSFAFACDSGCDPDVVDRAIRFVEAHKACVSDDDCIVVPDYCGELPGGFCGQLLINRSGAEAAEWRVLEDVLDDCASNGCDQCFGILVPRCVDGTCGGAE